MKLLNLTDSERNNVFVSYEVNRFIATCGRDGFLIGSYITLDAMLSDFSRNKIVGAKFDVIAQRMYLI